MSLSNVECEQALLGAILVNNDVYDRVASVVRPEDFFDPIHARIFEICRERIRAGDAATPTTIKAHFEGDEMKPLGGPAYLVRLAGAAISLFAARDYAKIVASLAKRREVRAILEEANASIDNPDKDLTAILGGIEAEILMHEAKRGIEPNVVSMRKVVVEAARAASAAYENGGAVGVTSGVERLDAMIGGFHPQQLVILAGRPSMGKSAAALSFSIEAARAGHNVAFFSLEMSNAQIALRAVSEETARTGPGIEYRAAMSGQVSHDELLRYLTAAKTVEALPIHFYDRSATVGTIHAEARKLHRRLKAEGKSLDLVVVDYLQIIQRHSRRSSTVEEITEISGALKQMAKDLDLPVIALSQLSRQVEQREDKRPQLSNLRDSGAIKQDADVVMFCYREDYYLERAKPKLGNAAAMTGWEEVMMTCAGTMDLIVAKQRMGPIGAVRVNFDAACNRLAAWGGRT